MRKIVFFLSILLAPIFSDAQEKSDPPNIILMIGDGMGLSQISASMYTYGNITNLEKFTTIGLIKTHSANSLITDSAASGTAMACGVKTINGSVGVDEHGSKLKSILEYSKEKGYKTGLVATSSIVHATPASFYANVSSRSNYESIALQLSQTDIVDYFIGGGLSFFNRRSDGKNLIEEMTTYDIAPSYSKFNNSEGSKIGLFIGKEEPTSVKNGRVSLSKSVNAVLGQLEQDQDPFFLMVEGSQIDWAGHASDIDYLTSEFHDFDIAIQAVLDYSEEHPNTLIIVTADHETGGLALVKGNIKTFKPEVNFSTGGHTATMVPLFAIGPHSQKFSGIYDNTEIFKKLLNIISK